MQLSQSLLDPPPHWEKKTRSTQCSSVRACFNLLLIESALFLHLRHQDLRQPLCQWPGRKVLAGALPVIRQQGLEQLLAGNQTQDALICTKLESRPSAKADTHLICCPLSQGYQHLAPAESNEKSGTKDHSYTIAAHEHCPQVHSRVRHRSTVQNHTTGGDTRTLPKIPWQRETQYPQPHDNETLENYPHLQNRDIWTPFMYYRHCPCAVDEEHQLLLCNTAKQIVYTSLAAYQRERIAFLFHRKTIRVPAHASHELWSLDCLLA